MRGLQNRPKYEKYFFILQFLQKRLFNILSGVYKVPYNMIFFPTPIFWILIFFPKFSYPLTHLIIFPTASILKDDDIASAFSFFHVIFFPPDMIFLFSLYNLIFFHNKLGKPPPPGGNKELYTSLYFICVHYSPIYV